MNLKKMKKIIILSFIGLCHTSSIIFALNQQEMVQLQADNVTYDYKKGIVTYEGNVVARQGETQLMADQMTVTYNQKHKIEQVVAIGKLARYQTQTNDGKTLLKASAKTIFYYPIDQKVVLKEQATVEYNQSQFSGPYIFYDMNNKVISSHPQKMSRSTIILEPFKQLKAQFK